MVTARALIGRAMELARRFGSTDAHVVSCQVMYAECYLAEGREADAERTYREAIALGERLAGTNSPVLVESLEGLGRLYDTSRKREFRRPEQAAALLRRILDLTRRNEPDSIALASRCRSLAEACHRLGRREEAERLTAEAAELLERRAGSGETGFWLDAADLRLRLGQHARAEADAVAALHVREGIAGAPRLVRQDPKVEEAVCYDHLGAIYLAWGRPEQALEAYRKAMEIGVAYQDPDTSDQWSRHLGIGRSLMALGRPAEAEPHLLRAQTVVADKVGNGGDQERQVLEALALLLVQRHQMEEAETIQKRAQGIAAELEKARQPVD